MSTSIGNVNTSPQNYAGIGIYCNVIDPSKLPPDSPLLKNPMPNCTIVGMGGNGSTSSSTCCYPPGYYMNNYFGNTIKNVL